LATVISAMREHRHRFDTSVGVSGPRDLTVRIDAVRRRDKHAATSTRPPHPASTFVTTAKRPSCEAGRRQETSTSEKTKAKNFTQQDWTGVIRLRLLAK
jgi:hypothetical protein